jgi:hypothetical protein
MDIYNSRNVTDCDKEMDKYEKCRTNCDKDKAKADKYNKCISSCEGSEGRKYKECVRLLDLHEEYHE